MNSVLVRGMEMPKNCSECPLNYDKMACDVTGTYWWSDAMVLMNFDSDKERLYNCPLIEVELVEDEEAIVPVNMIGGYLKREAEHEEMSDQ